MRGRDSNPGPPPPPPPPPGAMIYAVIGLQTARQWKLSYSGLPSRDNSIVSLFWKIGFFPFSFKKQFGTDVNQTIYQRSVASGEVTSFVMEIAYLWQL